MLRFQLLQNNVEKLYKNREKDDIEKILECKLVLLDTEASEFMNELEDHKYYKMNKKQLVDELTYIYDRLPAVGYFKLGLEKQILTD